VPCLCGFYPGICLTTEEKARKILSCKICPHLCNKFTVDNRCSLGGDIYSGYVVQLSTLDVFQPSCSMFDVQPQISFHREYIKLFLWPQSVPHRKQSTLRRPAMLGSHKCKQVLVER